MATTEQRKLWHVEFPLIGGRVVKLDLSAPPSEERADVIVTASLALSSVGVRVDPFEASARCVGPE